MGIAQEAEMESHITTSRRTSCCILSIIRSRVAPLRSLGMILAATSWPLTLSVARYTVPKLPLPNCSPRTYLEGKPLGQPRSADWRSASCGLSTTALQLVRSASLPAPGPQGSRRGVSPCCTENFGRQARQNLRFVYVSAVLVDAFKPGVDIEAVDIARRALKCTRLTDNF